MFNFFTPDPMYTTTTESELVPTIEQIEEALNFASKKCGILFIARDSKMFKLIYNDYLNAIMVYGSPLDNEEK